jgi:hypothetical protein
MKPKTAKQIKEFRHESVDIYKISRGCDICGYNKHPSSLCFDHLPEYEKSPITKNGNNDTWIGGGMYNLYKKIYTIADLINEIRKCRLLCHNCHMEQTYPNNKRASGSVSERLYSIDQLEQRLKDFEGNLV